MQLDGLSHFFFTPRPVVAEGKITSLSTVALPSLALEDIVPTVQSSASQLAPEQVTEKRKGRDASLLSKEELTSDDRKRLRRARKAAGTTHEEEADDNEPAGRKKKMQQQRAKEDKSLDEELRRDKRVVLSGKDTHGGSANDDGQSFSKSASFFSKLQENAQAEISGSLKNKNKKDKKNVVANSSGGKFKL